MRRTIERRLAARRRMIEKWGKVPVSDLKREFPWLVVRRKPAA